MALRQRLLRDIAELSDNPYPNIRFVPSDVDITKACLLLTPNGEDTLHLTMKFPDDYPLSPPTVTIQSRVGHPNVFGNYICASILNTTEGYTPAYTIKGVAIQLLSFFGSDSIEQTGGHTTYNLADYRARHRSYRSYYLPEDRPCSKCGHIDAASEETRAATRSRYSLSLDQFLPHSFPSPITSAPEEENSTTITNATTPLSDSDIVVKLPSKEILPILTAPSNEEPDEKPTDISLLPDELLVMICSHLETEELALFSRSWNRIGGESGIVSRFNIIRNRELICFCLKQGVEDLQLGIGVRVRFQGYIGSFESEFDLLSLKAFEEFDIRRSVQGLTFQEWIPLPISRNHYRKVKDLVETRLLTLARLACFITQKPSDVIYGFMNDIVVRLSNKASAPSSRSSLNHASEKAIESYYHLFHLLLCLVTENSYLVKQANQIIRDFLRGRNSKRDIPNLGYLLIMVLVADVEMTEDLLKAIIRETVTRNVVWMLEKYSDLSYMEANKISQYRLTKTFEASKTSYRLLMFLNVFRRTINRGHGTQRKTLVQMRETLFDAHGAPPRGTAARLANEIKDIQLVDSFPKFLKSMGLEPPMASRFTIFLRDCVEASVRKGYSVWGISQDEALRLRRQVDPDVQVADSRIGARKPPENARGSFFPSRSSGGRRGNASSQRGGRGRGRGRGHGY